MDALDQKLTENYPGRVVRKDLLHQIKKGTNVPSFVLEFLLAKYCASDDPEEIEAGKQAVIETLEQNFVRPDDANRAQALVEQKGKHKFIDRIHVRYVEKEKRYWAEMENFGSRRIAVAQKYYVGNDRILSGGIWAEVTLGYNEIEDDDYAFYVEDLRPIQLSRFSFDEYIGGREAFTRDEWLQVIIRTLGLDPTKMDRRLQFHFLARLFPFVESNYNFIELGPRGTGKSYAYSEFSPYSTLISGGQATTPILFYNNAKQKIGLVGFWDVVAFDEVASIRIKDADSIQIMKDYMANGRFSRGKDNIANASFAFVGNIDLSIAQVVNSAQHDLFAPLPKEFDLALMDRFHTYVPGWEMPKNTSQLLTNQYGFITDYLAAAFRELALHHNRIDWINKNVRLGTAIEGRDERAVKKTVSALLKILHPVGEPTGDELDEYVAYAIEGRRRIKEQLNKRKTDDEYANIALSFVQSNGAEQVVWCPESKNAQATQQPMRRNIDGAAAASPATDQEPVGDAHAGGQRESADVQSPVAETSDSGSTGDHPGNEVSVGKAPESGDTPDTPGEQHYRIHYGDMGMSYDSIFGDYLRGAKSVLIEDPYIRMNHQIQNLVRFCETVVNRAPAKEIHLVTSAEDEEQQRSVAASLEDLAQSLRDLGVTFTYEFRDGMHDRQIRLSNGWVVKIGRGLDIYQKPDSWFSVGANDMDLRPCMETMVDVFREKS
ncbi:MAG: BREX system Lon protease-like protein BrxL [Spirochaetota bacterium]